MQSSREVADWWDEAKIVLIQSDTHLAKIIDKMDDQELQSSGNLFATLIKSIVGQQISVIAASAVWDRFCELVGEITDENILMKSHLELRSVGLSNRKAEYIIGISEAWRGGLNLLKWESMTDEEVLKELITLRGVGRWTAQMLLIFALLRADIFPIDDIGLIRGMEKVYNSGNSLDNNTLVEISNSWKPYRTLGVWYMWRTIDSEVVEY
jgi:DNA-3-methyladenine glycosylase II